MNNQPIDLYFDYILGENGTNVIINNAINCVAIIKDIAERTYWFDKSIYVPSSVELNTGDVISFNGFTYIITSQIQNNMNSKQAYMKQSLFNLNFILNGKVRTFPAYAYTEATLTTNSSSVINVVDGTYKLVIPAKTASTYKNGDGSYMLDTNLRTIFDTYSLKIVGVDRTKKGIWILDCERDTKANDDDLINGIANTSNITHEYAVSIQQDNPTITVPNTYQLTAVATTDGVADSNPTLTWASSNTSVATVDSNGLVTAVAAGNSTITVTYHTATDSRTATIANAALPVYKWYYNNNNTGKNYITFSNNYYLKTLLQGDVCVFGIEKWVGDTQATTNDTYTWTVNRNGATTNYMTYQNTDTTITITNQQMYGSGYPTIYATPSSTGTQLTNYIEIQLNGAF